MRSTVVFAAIMLAASLAVSGCKEGGFSYKGSDPSFGGENASTLMPLLLSAINEIRNSASVAALQSDGTADNAMIDYVTNTWTPADDDSFLDPYLIMEHAVNPPFSIVPANDPGTGDAIMDGLGAMYFAKPKDVATRWNNGKHMVLVSTLYTHIGIGAADPNARWAAFFFRK